MSYAIEALMGAKERAMDDIDTLNEQASEIRKQVWNVEAQIDERKLRIKHMDDAITVLKGNA